MKSDWTTRTLKELVQFTSGGTPSKKRADYWIGSIPWISAKTLKSERITTSDLFISDEGLKMGSKIAPCGSILLLTRGSGLFNDIPIGLVEREVAFNQDIKCISSCSDVENKFVFYWLISQKSYLMAKVGVTGIGAGKFDLDFLQKLEVPIPSRQERKQIVAIVDALSDKIELNRRINDNLEQQVMALFHQIFDESNSNRKNIRADEYFNISIGKTPPRKEPQWFSDNPSDCVWVSISDMGSCGLYIEGSSEYLTRDAVKKFNVKIVPDNTVILSFKLTIGRVAITDGCMTTNEAIAHFKTDKPEINEYLYCYLKNFNFQTMGSTSSIATAVNSKIIKGMLFVIPTDKELENFHNIAAPLFTMIKSNQRESKHLSELRDILLPKLMSGEIDVSAIQL
ncbi:restriction endonuclease subunit S [Anaerotruncus colihominis]|uniref:restriction endonuclease subunit S n=1 Tax=Anaerotruncus colihominis TaxID=169435 RepID=UPI0035144C70